jgi:hypothetical protein
MNEDAWLMYCKIYRQFFPNKAAVELSPAVLSEMVESLRSATECSPTYSQLRWHLSALVDQCERGNLVDDHGHEFKMNKELIDARSLLSTPAAAPDTVAPQRPVSREEIVADVANWIDELCIGNLRTEQQRFTAQLVRNQYIKSRDLERAKPPAELPEWEDLSTGGWKK